MTPNGFVSCTVIGCIYGTVNDAVTLASHLATAKPAAPATEPNYGALAAMAEVLEFHKGLEPSDGDSVRTVRELREGEPATEPAPQPEAVRPDESAEVFWLFITSDGKTDKVATNIDNEKASNLLLHTAARAVRAAK